MYNDQIPVQKGQAFSCSRLMEETDTSPTASEAQLVLEGPDRLIWDVRSWRHPP